MELIFELSKLLNEDRAAKPVAFVWFILLGTALGAASSYVAPDRVLRSGPFIGISLVVVPALLGVVMEFWGRARASREHAVSHLATWYGGMAMGVGLAAGRLAALFLIKTV